MPVPLAVQHLALQSAPGRVVGVNKGCMCSGAPKAGKKSVEESLRKLHMERIGQKGRGARGKSISIEYKSAPDCVVRLLLLQPEFQIKITKQERMCEYSSKANKTLSNY